MTFLLIRYNPKVWLHVSVAILLFVIDFYYLIFYYLD